MFRRLLAAAAAGALVAGAGAVPAQAAAPTGTVTGTFTSFAGAPISGATVSILNEAGDYRGGARTQADGTYVVHGVNADRVKLRFAQGRVVQWAHQELAEADAEFFPIPDGGTLTVDETQLPVGTVAGTFRTFAGEPIDYAKVEAYALDNRLLAEGRTAADGRYQLDRVLTEPVKIKFDINNVVQWATQAPDFASAQAFPVAAGQTVTVDETQVQLGRITGTVSAADGGPAPGFWVYAVAADGSTTVRGEAPAGGRYVVNVPAGQWKVRVSSDIAGDQYVPQKPTADGATVFGVATGETITVDETLRPIGAIKGTLEYGRDRPVADEQINLWQGDTIIETVWSESDGGYYFGALEPGVYLVSWESPLGGQSYVPGTLDRDAAERITVRAGRVTVANTADQPPAVVHGKLTTPDGAPVSGYFVDIRSVPAGYGYREITADDGTWSVDDLSPGDYKISFSADQGNFVQYAYGRTNADEAQVFTFAPGSTTTVDDVWLQGASLRVTAVDETTGEPVTRFCASVWLQGGDHCTDGSEVTIPGLVPGATTIYVAPKNSSNYLPRNGVPVTVGSTDAISVPLALGGRVAVEVVSRATGAPEGRTNVSLIAPGDGTSAPAQPTNQTHRNGKITTYAVPAGMYQMFVDPTTISLGAQWVGADGGTGDQKQAKKIKVKAGKVTRLPQVLLDPSGAVSYTVRDEAGNGLNDVSVGPDAWSLDISRPCCDSDPNGVGRLSGLGPYEWPLLFTPPAGGYPRQWSGSTGNRFQAETVSVRPNETTTYLTALSPGARLTGTVTVAQSFTSGRITAVNAATGDILATADFTSADRTYDMRVIGGGPVLLSWSLTGPAAAGSWPDKVSVPRSGTKNVNLTITGS